MKKFEIFSFGKESGTNTYLWGIEARIEAVDKVTAINKFTSSTKFERMLKNSRSIFVALEVNSTEYMEFNSNNIILDDSVDEVRTKCKNLIWNYEKDYYNIVDPKDKDIDGTFHNHVIDGDANPNVLNKI